MAKHFHVEIVTPQQVVYAGEVESVTLPGIVAPFQVLVNHAPILTALEIGDIKIVRDLGHGTAEQTRRVLEAMPRWTPASLAGQAVRVRYTLPISFTVK